MDVRLRIEHLFERLARWIYNNRLKVLLLTVLVSLPAVSALNEITIDTTNEGFFSERDPVLKAYNEFKREFGSDEFFVVALEPPEVFDIPFLEKLRRLHAEIEEEVPHVKEVTSLVNARDMRGEGDSLVVGELMDDWPETPEDLERLRERALSNPLFVRTLISEDASITTLVVRARAYEETGEEDALAGFGDVGEEGPVEFLDSSDHVVMADAIREVVARYETKDFPIRLAGSPFVIADLNRGVEKTLKTFIPISTLIIILFCYLMFRRLTGVFYPFIIIWLSLVVSIGIMGLIRMPLTLVTQILPTFLMVVGMGDSVHILAVFYMRYEETGDKEGSIVYALGHSGLAVLMTSLTTSAGLASFAAAEVKPIVELGVIAPVGVMIALVYTVVLLPALISLFPVTRRGLGLGSTGGRMDRALEWIARVSCARHKRIIVISAVIFAVSLGAALQIRFSHNALKWFPKDKKVRVDTEYLDSKLAGSVSLEAVVDTGEEGGLYDPGFLVNLDGSAVFVEGIRDGSARIGKAVGIHSIVKEINRALNEDREEAYVIPDSRELVAQELLLFEGSGSDDLEDFTDSAFERARFTMTAPFDDAVVYTRILKKVRAHLNEAFPDAVIRTTGIMPLFVEMINNTIRTMTKSYAIALVIITLMMIILIGRVRIGMLSMIPNLLPILMILGIMGFGRIPMDFSNVLVGSVAIGLVVDDTIHFFHNFRRYYDETGDVDRAVSMTLQTTGRAIAITSMILAAGFYVWMFAEMKNTFYYALLTGSAVLFALVADFFLTPALLKAVHGRKGTVK